MLVEILLVIFVLFIVLIIGIVIGVLFHVKIANGEQKALAMEKRLHVSIGQAVTKEMQWVRSEVRQVAVAFTRDLVRGQTAVDVNVRELGSIAKNDVGKVEAVAGDVAKDVSKV